MVEHYDHVDVYNYYIENHEKYVKETEIKVEHEVEYDLVAKDGNVKTPTGRIVITLQLIAEMSPEIFDLKKKKTLEKKFIMRDFKKENKNEKIKNG